MNADLARACAELRDNAPKPNICQFKELSKSKEQHRQRINSVLQEIQAQIKLEEAAKPVPEVEALGLPGLEQRLQQIFNKPGIEGDADPDGHQVLQLRELDVVDTARQQLQPAVRNEEPEEKPERLSHMSRASKASAYRYNESKQGLYEKVLKHHENRKEERNNQNQQQRIDQDDLRREPKAYHPIIEVRLTKSSVRAAHNSESIGSDGLLPQGPHMKQRYKADGPAKRPVIQSLLNGDDLNEASICHTVSSSNHQGNEAVAYQEATKQLEGRNEREETNQSESINYLTKPSTTSHIIKQTKAGTRNAIRIVQCANEGAKGSRLESRQQRGSPGGSRAPFCQLEDSVATVRSKMSPRGEIDRRTDDALDSEHLNHLETHGSRATQLNGITGFNVSHNKKPMHESSQIHQREQKLRQYQSILKSLGENRYGMASRRPDAAASHTNRNPASLVHCSTIKSESRPEDGVADKSLEKSNGSLENMNREGKVKKGKQNGLANLKTPPSFCAEGQEWKTRNSGSGMPQMILTSANSREFWQVKAARTPLSEKSAIRSGKGSNADIKGVDGGDLNKTTSNQQKQTRSQSKGSNEAPADACASKHPSELLTNLVDLTRMLNTTSGMPRPTRRGTRQDRSKKNNYPKLLMLDTKSKEHRNFALRQKAYTSIENERNVTPRTPKRPVFAVDAQKLSRQQQQQTIEGAGFGDCPLQTKGMRIDKQRYALGKQQQRVPSAELTAETARQDAGITEQSPRYPLSSNENSYRDKVNIVVNSAGQRLDASLEVHGVKVVHGPPKLLPEGQAAQAIKKSALGNRAPSPLPDQSIMIDDSHSCSEASQEHGRRETQHHTAAGESELCGSQTQPPPQAYGQASRQPRLAFALPQVAARGSCLPPNKHGAGAQIPGPAPNSQKNENLNIMLTDMNIIYDQAGLSGIGLGSQSPTETLRMLQANEGAKFELKPNTGAAATAQPTWTPRAWSQYNTVTAPHTAGSSATPTGHQLQNPSKRHASNASRSPTTFTPFANAIYSRRTSNAPPRRGSPLRSMLPPCSQPKVEVLTKGTHMNFRKQRSTKQKLQHLNMLNKQMMDKQQGKIMIGAKQSKRPVLGVFNSAGNANEVVGRRQSPTSRRHDQLHAFKAGWVHYNTLEVPASLDGAACSTSNGGILNHLQNPTLTASLAGADEEKSSADQKGAQVDQASAATRPFTQEMPRVALGPPYTSTMRRRLVVPKPQPRHGVQGVDLLNALLGIKDALPMPQSRQYTPVIGRRNGSHLHRTLNTDILSEQGAASHTHAIIIDNQNKKPGVLSDSIGRTVRKGDTQIIRTAQTKTEKTFSVE